MKQIDYKKQERELFKRTERYAANVRTIYRKAFGEIINLVKGTDLTEGVPFSFHDYGYSEQVTKILRRMYSQVYQEIRSGVEKEWLNANENNDALVQAVFGKDSINDAHFARYFLRNEEAMNAFFARKTQYGGMNLSQRVWNNTGQFKEELENTLDLAIGEGTPSMQMAAKVKKYLNNPDMFFRRFRVKIGEDEFGQPVYGRKWKRRIWSEPEQQYRWIDADPKNYRTGRGVYKSSARNAQRLCRTETNMAYRSADFERWQQLDFVTGIEIKLSNNHPCYDICDDLKGKYPKDFKWTGWHPNCRCYSVPLLAKPEEVDKMLDKILDGDDPSEVDTEKVDKLPKEFTSWRENNVDRILRAKQRGTLPYFIRDNERLVFEKPFTPKEAAVARHRSRTEDKENRIKEKWNTRRAVYQYGNNVANILRGITDVDTSRLTEAVRRGNQPAILSEAKDLKKIGKDIYALDLLDDPMSVARQFSMSEAVELQKQVEKRLRQLAEDNGSETWSKLPDETKHKVLGNEIESLVIEHKDKYWEVLRDAYEKLFKQLVKE